MVAIGTLKPATKPNTKSETKLAMKMPKSIRDKPMPRTITGPGSDMSVGKPQPGVMGRVPGPTGRLDDLKK